MAKSSIENRHDSKQIPINKDISNSNVEKVHLNPTRINSSSDKLGAIPIKVKETPNKSIGSPIENGKKPINSFRTAKMHSLTHNSNAMDINDNKDKDAIANKWNKFIAISSEAVEQLHEDKPGRDSKEIKNSMARDHSEIKSEILSLFLERYELQNRVEVMTYDRHADLNNSFYECADEIEPRNYQHHFESKSAGSSMRRKYSFDLKALKRLVDNEARPSSFEALLDERFTGPAHNRKFLQPLSESDLTESGKLIELPIDNEKYYEEAGSSSERDVKFYEHVHIKKYYWESAKSRLASKDFELLWKNKNLKDFLDLVLLSLSNNAHMKLDEKYSYLTYFENYFIRNANLL
ncbi:MAG: ribosomal protein S31 [Marteilia pararefringens]